MNISNEQEQQSKKLYKEIAQEMINN